MTSKPIQSAGAAKHTRSKLCRLCSLGFLALATSSCQSEGPLPVTTPPPYGSSARSACAKAEFIWNERILPSRYAQLPPLTTPGLLDLLKLLSSRYSVKSLSHEGDEMEIGRRKLVHAFGAEARLKLVVDPAASSGYTGIFLRGSDCVIGRFSMASKPSPDRSIPALALKFFIDGDRPSLDLLVMNSVDGQVGHNFFSQSFSNIIPPPKGLAVRVLGAAFGRSAKLYGAKDPNPGRLTLEHLAGMAPDGVAVADPREPYQLIFKPTEQATALMQGSPAGEDFRVSLASLPPGAMLYDVYTRATADEHEAPRLLGHLVLASPVVSSRYGDQTLYFRHNMARR